MATLAEIEKLAKDLAEARQNLRDGIADMEEKIAVIKKQYLPAIRRAIEKAAGWHQRLFAAIEETPELFVRPKTMIFHGIKLGYQKSRGEIVWEDESQVIKLLKKHFPEDHENFIKMTEHVVKASLSHLSAVDLKKIGVTIIETGDEVIIRPMDSEIDKLINALLKDEEEIREAA